MIEGFSNVPSTPGVYQFFDDREIIYIGKAKVLNKRVRSYFTKSIKDRKTEKIKNQCTRVETFSTHTEAEALILEQQLIKEYKPKFNILLRDDKTYPFIYFDYDHKFPSISLKRNRQAINENYFGPFVSAKFAKQQIKDLQKLFKIRNCADSTFANRSRACIEYQMKRCSAPCVRNISFNNYLEDVSNAKRFLTSERRQLKNIFKDTMKKHAARLNFEEAQKIKEKINAIEVLEKESQITTKPIDLDIISIAIKHQATGVALLSVRGGRIQCTKTYFFKDSFDNNLDNLLQRVCFTHYQQKSQIAPKILVNINLKEKAVLEEGLSKKFDQPVKLVTSKNKNNMRFQALANLNAAQAIINKLGEADKFKEHFKALGSIFNAVNQKHTLECIDISHHSGGFSKAAIVHFSSKGKEKKYYRTYNIPSKLAANDIGSIEYVVHKRLGKNKNHPTYLLIDGGKNQLNAALKAKPHDSKVNILSIAKGANRKILTETIFTFKGDSELPTNSFALKFLLLARDEAHRFAIKANRMAKQKSMQYSILDTIDGVGPKTKTRLMKQFKSLKNLSNTSIEEMVKISGITRQIALNIKTKIK